MTLLGNVVKTLHRMGYRPADVRCIIVEDEAYPWEDFEQTADFDYESDGSTLHVINQSLVIVMSDGGWFERTLAAGGAVWEYHNTPAVIWSQSNLTKAMLLEH